MAAGPGRGRRGGIIRDAIELFRQEHDLVRQMVDGLVFPGMDAAQLHPTTRPRGRTHWPFCSGTRPATRTSSSTGG